MKTRLFSLIVVIAALAAVGGTAPESVAQDQPLGLPDIKMLAKNGVSDDVILSQIRNSHTVYHLTAPEIIELKDAGVSQRVIDFMINTPRISPGGPVVGPSPVVAPVRVPPPAPAPPPPATATVVAEVGSEPPPPVVEQVVVSPGPDYVWVAGHWRWHGRRWVWVRGAWLIPSRRGAVWVEGHWGRRFGRVVWIDGRWR